MIGQWIDIATDDGVFKAYLTLPSAGSGPGIVLCQEIFGVNANMRAVADLYAEEGYVVLAPDLFWRLEPGVELGYGEADFQKAMGLFNRFDLEVGVADCAAALRALKARPECTGSTGAVGFCLGGKLSFLMASRTDVDCAIAYYPVFLLDHLDEAKNIKCPMALHLPEQDHLLPPEARLKVEAALATNAQLHCYVYPGAGHAFAAPARAEYDQSATLLAHTRSLALLRSVLGPNYDLEKLWERHQELEFMVRSASETMKTMISQPYVNHVPTMTGGFGANDLFRFYEDVFIPQLPKDSSWKTVSRTVGVERVIDEFVFCFTHDIYMDWMLPGLAPTNRYVEVPMVVIVRFRGDKLYNEHIYWDQASVLVQIGALDAGELPVAGRESAQKVLDATRPSNEMMRDWKPGAAGRD
jgi:carboxymethylenebutenolidase